MTDQNSKQAVEVQLVGSKRLSKRVSVYFKTEDEKQKVNPQIDDLLLVSNDERDDDFLRVAMVVKQNSDLPDNGWRYVRDMAGWGSPELIDLITNLNLQTFERNGEV